MSLDCRVCERLDELSTMGKTKAVVYWLDSEQVSSEDLSKINEEDRHVGAITTVKSGNKFHRGVVRFISSDILKLSEKEEEICLEIEEMVQKRKDAENDALKKGRGNRRKRVSAASTASANQVASAVGERLKPLTPQQVQKAKEVAAARKATEASQRAAQDEVDQEVLRDAIDDDDLFVESDGDDHVDDGHDVKKSGNEDDSVSNDNTNCCKHCLDLQQAYKDLPNYLRVLTRFSEFAQGTKGTIEYLEVLPVPSDTPKVGLTKGSKVFLSISDKNSIKRDGDGDPSKMTRLALLAVFGRQNVETTELTAKGQKKGCKGIRPHVLKALKDLFENL
ncbi:hypothetical protein ONE63_009579 [Megalurothrips usitatus]|uniref:BEN domain-containing protein n=1 Tax=Megalurothrips usitatus TaxID=439358 RepID=A0AAV7XLF5_9NEOP|nr:hypothetical protein ONE63_009579 [Megalurothrips usitatus]